MDLKLLGSRRRVHANINLGVSNIDAFVSSRLESSLERLLVGCCARRCLRRLARKMRLVTNTVDLDTVRLDELDNPLRTGSLVTVVLKVVIIV